MISSPGWAMAGLAIGIGLVSGCLFGMQPSVNGHLSRHLAHPLQASVISFATGTLILVVLALATGVFPPRFQSSPSSLPWWCWTGGAIGVVLVTASLFFVPRIGSLPWHAAIITGQLFAALILDHFGWLGNQQEPISKARVIGVALLMTGITIIFWDKTTPKPSSSELPRETASNQD